jgi:hypothetical protein
MSVLLWREQREDYRSTVCYLPEEVGNSVCLTSYTEFGESRTNEI